MDDDSLAVRAGVAINYPGTGNSDNPKNNSDYHLHIVVKVDRGNVYLLPISSSRTSTDETCLISRFCGWGAISKDCHVLYMRMKIISERAVIDQISRGKAHHKGIVPQNIYDRAVAGIEKSSHIPMAYKDLFFQPKDRKIWTL